MAGGIAEILADTADENIVLARRVDRHREVVPRPVIDDLDARRVGQDRAHIMLGDRPFAFEGDRLAMGAQHRYAHAGDADRDLIVLEDLAGLLDHLGLFVVVAGLGIDSRVVAEQVEGVVVRDRLGLEDAAFEMSAGRFHQLLHHGGTAAARRLVGRQDDALDAVLPVDRPQRHQRGDRRTVRNGDDALVLPDTARVDLRDHQRHVRVHAEGRGIVDHDRAGPNGRGRELPGGAATCREQRDVDALDDDFLTAEVDGLAGRPGAGQRLELADRKGAPVHGGDEFGADSAGHAGNGYNGFVAHGSILFG